MYQLNSRRMLGSAVIPLLILAATAAVGAPGADPTPPSAPTLSITQLPLPPSESASSPQAEASSYSLGLSFSTQWRESGLDTTLNQEALIRGIKAGLAGSALTDEDRKRASSFLQQSYEAWAERNQSAADAFLAKNRTATNVKTTASGLQYLVLKAGDESAPAAGPADRVTVQYRGRLLDGREFDSTYSRGKPAVVRSDVVIAGWREVLGLMHPGCQWRVFVPPSLGYGKTPPESLPPDSLLVFDIEVVTVQRVGNPASPVSPTS